MNKDICKILSEQILFYFSFIKGFHSGSLLPVHLLKARTGTLYLFRSYQ